MRLPVTVEVMKKYLFADVDEMTENRVPQVTQNRILRLRDMYNYWLQYPRLKDLDIVHELMKRHKISKSIAYEDLRVIKYLLGDLNKASKDYHRYRFIQRNQETYDTAKRLNDAKAMAACDNTYAKYTQLDKEDAQDLGYDKIVVQPFVPTADPTVIGIKPVPNIRQKSADKNNSYWAEDMDEVQPEMADFNEDEIFHPELKKENEV